MYDDMSQEQPAPKSNVLGIVGFVLSILCLTAPLGLLLSLIALRRPPRGMAIAGTIVGVIFSAILIIGAWFVSLTIPYAVSGGKMIGVMQEAQGQSPPPADLSGLNIPVELQTDQWGNAFRYELSPDGSTFTLTTAGPDGQFDTADDLSLDSSMSDDAMSQELSEWISESMNNRFSGGGGTP